jgi:hypothetical protein
LAQKRIILKKYLVLCVFLSFYFALSGRAATYFSLLRQSKVSKRKATPVAGLLRKLPSLHMLLAAGTSRCAPDRPCFRQNKRSAVSAKLKTCSVRLRQGEGGTDYAFQAA